MGSFSAGTGTGTQGRVFIATRGAAPLEPYVLISAPSAKYIFTTVQYAQQFDNGAWVTKTARVFRDGAWRDTYLYLFNMGVAGVPWSHAIGEGIGNNNSSITGQALRTTGTYTAGAGAFFPTYATTNQVNMQGKNTLKATINYFTAGQNASFFGVHTSRQIRTIPTSPANAAAYVQITSTGTYSINISSLSGSYFVGFSTGLGATTSTAYMDATQVWAE